MEEYLAEIEFAISPVFKAIWHENDELESLESQKVQLFRNHWAKLHTALTGSGTVIEPAKVIITGSQPNKFFDPEEEQLYQKDDETKILKNRLHARQFAVDALSGTLLQFARQGVSIVHGGLEACPKGRSIGSQTLKSVIWNARNQAIHWEDDLRNSTQDCFRQLTKEFGIRFANFNTQNLGFEIIKMLEWKSISDFKRDMFTLK